MNDKFYIAGIRSPVQDVPRKKQKWYKGMPLLSMFVLAVLITGCLACRLVMTKDPMYMDLRHYSVPPDGEFLFGTDPMGRDIFSMVWYGGRISLGIGLSASLLSVCIAIVVGAASGCAPDLADALLMRLTEILLSVPNLLAVLFLLAGLGGADAWRISAVLGMTSWMGMAKIIRTQVRQICHSEYILAAKCMGGGFFYILRTHLMPHVVPSILFMAVMNIRNAIAAESTLSFMGIGLPVEVVSWGSMLSLAQKAFLTNAWWIILVPGAFLTITLICMTNIGNYVRKRFSGGQSSV